MAPNYHDALSTTYSQCPFEDCACYAARVLKGDLKGDSESPICVGDYGCAEAPANSLNIKELCFLKLWAGLIEEFERLEFKL